MLKDIQIDRKKCNDKKITIDIVYISHKVCKKREKKTKDLLSIHMRRRSVSTTSQELAKFNSWNFHIVSLPSSLSLSLSLSLWLCLLTNASNIRSRATTISFIGISSFHKAFGMHHPFLFPFIVVDRSVVCFC